MAHYSGFVKGTKILTVSEDGLIQAYKSIEDIKAGDIVVSARTQKHLYVIHCGFKKVSKPRLITLKKNFFEKNLPFEDVIMQGDMRIFMKVLNTDNISSFLFSELYNLPVWSADDIEIYIIDIENNQEGIIVAGVPIQSFQKNGLWERFDTSPN